MTERAPSRVWRSAPRGSIYVLVLITVAAAVAMVLTGMALQRVWARWTGLTADQAEARVLARSALELGAQYVNSNTNWRTTLASNGRWLTNAALGHGAISVVATDPVDGNFTNNPDDPLVLTGTGVVGQAQQMVSITLTPVYQAMPVLSTSLFATTAIDPLRPGATLTSSNVAASNGYIKGGGCIVATPVEAVGTITGTLFASTQMPGVAARTFPTLAQASAYYTGAASGTILRSNISGSTIQKVLISPASNPYGGTVNAQGIYVIDCSGGSLTIRNCRIVGTLIVLNCSTLTISNSVLWEPAVAGYPAVIVNGQIKIDLSGLQLSEVTLLTNFNPPGTPYNGSSNILTLDTYPCKIRGIIYCDGNFSTPASDVLTLQGTVLCGGTIDFDGTATITNDPNLTSFPPPGFRTGPTMVVQAGSWKQLVQ